MTQPRVLVDDGPGAARRLHLEAAGLESAGWQVIDGFETRPSLTRVVLSGAVATPRDAAAALLAALDGFGLLVHATADQPTRDRLVDDLRRLGPVHHIEDPQAVAADAPVLSDEGRAILALLAEGYTLGEAARRLSIGRRTADRRLAEVRRVLGAERTTEAIAIASRRGMLGPR